MEGICHLRCVTIMERNFGGPGMQRHPMGSRHDSCGQAMPMQVYPREMAAFAFGLQPRCLGNICHTTSGQAFSTEQGSSNVELLLCPPVWYVPLLLAVSLARQRDDDVTQCQQAAVDVGGLLEGGACHTAALDALAAWRWAGGWLGFRYAAR